MLPAASKNQMEYEATANTIRGGASLWSVKEKLPAHWGLGCSSLAKLLIYDRHHIPLLHHDDDDVEEEGLHGK
jgi:hypothetical protein